MIDLHTHTLFSDGVLLASELIRRAEEMGHRAIGLADHVDMGTLDWVVPRVVRVCEENNASRTIRAIPAVEITHVPPRLIGRCIAEARGLGAKLVVVHGETVVEPVEPGTNRAAIEGRVDILAHPGLLTPEEARLAAENGVCLEISARKGHCLTNWHVARLAREAQALLVLDTDAHGPGDLIGVGFARMVALGAGLTGEEYERIRGTMERLAGFTAERAQR
ncbi:MAG: histidinol phosphate phosphatase domain-containing protein [Deltaproteobacteria bacterium]|nr:histidinol phosphate phosphatase domain-containing protein [Deltaproteobacteria bacterium]